MNNGWSAHKKICSFVLLSEKKENVHGYNGKKNTGKALVGLEDYP